MTIELTEASRVIWYLEIPSGNFLAHIEELSGGAFKLQYRFRYKKDNKAFDSDDEKSWYTVQPKENAPPGPDNDLQYGIAMVREMVAFMKENGGGDGWELMRGAGTLEQFAKALMRLPFSHSKVLKK